MATRDQTPEQKARDNIDAMLEQAGWMVQPKKKIDFNAGPGIAVREYDTDVGPADYVLFVNKQAVGVIEAKPENWGQKITTVEDQSQGYAAAELKWVKNNAPLPFVYESTGVITRFTDGHDPKPRSREVFTFHRPETLREWLTKPASLRGRLHNLPALDPAGLRKCQIKAIENLETSFKEDRPRALIQMATGTDVKPLECLLFMRDVKSRNYFEQMKGRGTRTLDYDDLKKVTPSAVSAKTHYVIVDAIGVTKPLKTDSQPLITKPSVPLKDLAMGVMMGARDEDTVSSLAGRLARLNKQLDDHEQRRIKEKAGGVTLTQMVGNLLDAIDPDRVESRACEIAQQPENTNPGDDARQKARDEMVGQAANVFTGDLVELLDGIRRDKEQTIDHENLDTLQLAEWAGDAEDNAKQMVQEFAEYLEANRDEIEALTIFYQTPQRRSELTYDMIHEVFDKLKTDRPRLAPLRVWQAYAYLDHDRHSGESWNPVSELTALVALIRRACGIDEKITPYADTVRRDFQNWIMAHHSGGGEKFNEEQMDWLRMIRDHIISSFHMERDDLDMAPFDAKGGMGRMHQLFGERMGEVIEELNEALAA